MKSRFKIATAAVLIGGCITLLSFTSEVSFFDISKNLSIFSSLYRELNTYYADTLNHDKAIAAGINEMLHSLDPYTDYIPEEDEADYRMTMTGRYGGIGALISRREDYVLISDPYDGFPAAKAGLRAGDKIVAVDGKSAKSQNTDEVSKMLKGKPGTPVKIRYIRLDASEKETEQEITLIREEIKIKNVPYSGMVDEGIGFIRLANFTERAGQEVSAALNALQTKNQLKGMVLDLRGNPGGLLNEAINVSNVFVPRHTQIVSTKGKLEEWNKDYYALNDAVDTKLPIVVLADGGSASAAEIVAGSLQDLDRAVVVGQKTFGKGLVQSTKELPYNTQLKLTTAKYYIPSGRCIQAINYAEKDAAGSVKKLPDSLRVAFKTKNGRTVFDGSGIEPDIATEPEKLSNIAISLISKNILFDYATIFRARNEKIAEPKSFSLNDAQYEDFVRYVKTKDYDYTTQSEKLMDELEKAAEKDKAATLLKGDLASMKTTLKHDKEQDLYKNKAQLKSLLEEEIVSRYYGNSGRVETGFRSDSDLKRAIDLLKDTQQVQKILAKK